MDSGPLHHCSFGSVPFQDSRYQWVKMIDLLSGPHDGVFGRADLDGLSQYAFLPDLLSLM